MGPEQPQRCAHGTCQEPRVPGRDHCVVHNQLSKIAAFAGTVELSKWSYTSSQGKRITLKLEGRDQLSHFEKATKRRGGRAGQRYRCYWADVDGMLIDDMPEECYFVGASWHHSTGAHITIELEEIEAFTGLATRDQAIDGEGHKFLLTLVELTDDDKPVDQERAEQLEALTRHVQGGPQSKRAAILMRAPDFRRYVAIRLWGSGATGDKSLATEKEADAWMKKTIGISSKIELDHDPAALERFNLKVMGSFLQWGRAQERQARRPGDGPEARH